MKIKSIKKITNHDSDRYDLQVEGTHNFYANGILVHNSFCCIGVLCERDAHPEYGRLAVSSKGLGARGLVFQPEAPANEKNLYLRAARQHGVFAKVTSFLESFGGEQETSLFILGEVYGNGVQDLQYGADAGQGDIGFRMFDVFVRSDSQDDYVDEEGLAMYARYLDLERAPVLYQGPYSLEVVRELTDGKETVSGEEANIREGVVIKPAVERRDDAIGRVILKSVSEAYLTRRDGTEYN